MSPFADPTLIPAARLTHRKSGGVRARTLPDTKDRGGLGDLDAGARRYPRTKRVRRPRTWGECLALGLGTRNPCPFVGCSKHLYLDVNMKTGGLKMNFPDRQPWELAETCSLAVALKGPRHHTALGRLLNVCRERARQLEVRAMKRLKSRTEALHAP